MVFQFRCISSLHKTAISKIISIARKRAKEADLLHKHEVSSKVRHWAKEALDHHAKGAHAYLRKADSLNFKNLIQDEGSMLDELIDEEGGEITTYPGDDALFFEPKVSCSRRTKEWERTWSRDKEEISRTAQAIAEVRQLALQEQHRPDILTDEEVEQAVRDNRNGRTVGNDLLAPMDWKRLPKGAIGDLAAGIRGGG